MKRFFLTVALLLPFHAWGAQSTEGLLQMLDYVGVDYPGAVSDGQVVNSAEYAEMQDFVAGIGKGVQSLPAGGGKETLQAGAKRLEAFIRNKADSDQVAGQVAAMREVIIANYAVTTVPRRLPDMALAQELFQANCAACHGLAGGGDGPQAAGLEPSPTDFRDSARHAQRSLYGLYNTITLGVKGTAMSPFPALSEHERWSLAFYVGQLGAPAPLTGDGERLWQASGSKSPLASLEAVTTISPAEAGRAAGAQGQALLTYLRSHPEPLFRQQSPLAFAKAQLGQAVAAYRRGQTQAAYGHAVAAYLEGFELTEAGLNAVAPELREQIERQMTAFRNRLRSEAPVETVEQEQAQLLAALHEAEGYLDNTMLSPGAAFAGAFVILLREGLEAILVVAAFVAFLTRTGRRDGIPYLHAGWLGALAAGALTWYVSSYVVQIGGAGREVTEGVAAVFAAAVLFGLGFWMHDKSHAAQWKRFIEERMNRALGSATLWSLALLVFVVVYREIFETILFYQALWVQTSPAGQGMVGAGFVAAVAGLAVLAWLILRYSQRLPLRQFFGVTGVFLLVLAVVFAGKGIAALQEAGKLPVSPLDLPSVDLLGLYPNLQGLAVQSVMILVAIGLFALGRRRSLRTEAGA